MRASKGASKPRVRAIVAAVVVVLALAASAIVVLVVRGGSPACGSDEHRVAASDVPAVFAAPASAISGDARLSRLVSAARGWGLGPVVGAVGFDYGRWLTVAGLPDGLMAWTKDNAVAGVLGTDLRPHWGIRQAKVQHAYDVGDTHFLQLELAKDRSLQVSAYRLTDGRRTWCATVGTTPTRYGDPLGTAPLAGGDLLVLADASSGHGALTRLDAQGRSRWTGTVRDVDRGDYLGDLGQGIGLAGGRPASELDQDATSAIRGLTAFDERTGKREWTYAAPFGGAHVVGVDPRAGLVAIEEGNTARGSDLVVLDRTGKQVWARPGTPGVTLDAALRADVVLLRHASALEGIDLWTGRTMWRRPSPPAGRSDQGQFFPYGFDLDSQPMLDDTHLLLGTTTALRSLDLQTGRMTSYPLPTDGINTTYWPYQLAVSDGLLVVVTNTGAVALDRTSGHGPANGA